MFMDYKTYFKNNTKYIQILASFLLGISIGIAIIKILCSFNILNLNPKQYVYVDVERVINSVNESLVEQTKAKTMSDAEVSDKLILAKNKFNFLLQNYTQKHNAVVFSSSKVIAGATDITEYLTKEILVEIK